MMLSVSPVHIMILSDCCRHPTNLPRAGYFQTRLWKCQSNGPQMPIPEILNPWNVPWKSWARRFAQWWLLQHFTAYNYSLQWNTTTEPLLNYYTSVFNRIFPTFQTISSNQLSYQQLVISVEIYIETCHNCQVPTHHPLEDDHLAKENKHLWTVQHCNMRFP